MAERTHTVENGKITRLSVSQVEKFDPESSVWGCNRRWWFRYVARLPEPQTKSQSLGEDVHRQIEHYLKTGEDVLGPIARAGKHFLPAPGSDLLVEMDIPEGGLAAAGIPFAGRIDLVNLRNGVELVDWKTTSDVKYAKTQEQLRDSVQMTGYAKWAMETYKVESVALAHGVFGTKILGARKIPCEVNWKTVTYNWSSVEEVVERMKSAAGESDVSKVQPNRSACRVGRFECPFLNRCPGGNPLASLLDRFVPAAAPQVMPTATETPAQPEKKRLLIMDVPGVLPPDAPKSDPKLAADPVPDFVAPAGVGKDPAPVQASVASGTTAGAAPALAAPATETPKRGPGRPRKTEATKTEAPANAQAEHPPSVAKITVDHITIRKGAKIGLPNYSSASVEVELSAQVAGNIAEAFKLLEAQVEAELRRQTEPLKSSPAA